MSEISVHRTAAGGRCLVIDGTRVAGGKPEFSGDNCVYWWETNETIGVVDDLEAENTRLKTENAKLRERVSELEELTDHRHYIPQEWYATLQAENAKLKELVRDMWICVSHGSGWDCTGCERDPDSVCIMGISEFLYRMHKLGVEVNDAPDEPMSDAARRVFDRLMSELGGDGR